MKMTRKPKLYGFGFCPEEKHHFYIVIPKDKKNDVEIYERYYWDDSKEQEIGSADVLKLRVPREKWNALADSISFVFNRQLKEDGRKAGKFKIGGTPVSRLLGKEMMVLLWGTEGMDISRIPTVIRNWQGFAPEERWWLYTETNAVTGGINDTKGWRMALKHILCENPIM